MCLPAGLPDENFNKKPNSVKKGQTNYLKARKKSNFVCGIAIHLSQKYSNCKNITGNVLRN